METKPQCPNGHGDMEIANIEQEYWIHKKKFKLMTTGWTCPVCTSGSTALIESHAEHLHQVFIRTGELAVAEPPEEKEDVPKV
jgi:hypothetical protein